MVTALLILKIVLLIIASLIFTAYLLLQLYQKVTDEPFKTSTLDLVLYSVVAFLFGFGTNSYYGLLAFLPMLLLKFICQKSLRPNKLGGSGRWVEVNWKKLSLKGFEGKIPKVALMEMEKMPKSTHFVIPRLYMKIFLHMMLKKFNKEMNNYKNPMAVSNAQQNMATQEFQQLMQKMLKLQTGKMERKDFPFGVLKVTRL